MTKTSAREAATGNVASQHGAVLHRLAAMLTGDSDAATALTAATLSSAGPSADLHGLQVEIVRRYLRSEPRRREGTATGTGDAADVLRDLRPRARAASALRLAEGWDADEVAAAVGVARRRVDSLVPPTPGLDLALAALADRHTLDGPRLTDELTSAIEAASLRSRGERRPRRRVATGAVILALLGGYAALGGDDEAVVDDTGDSALAAPAPTHLTGEDWELNDEGQPPRIAMGLHLRETVDVGGAARSGVVTLPSAGGPGYASFGVLWCDMPPIEDSNVEVPRGTLIVDGTKIALPCAGRDGSPPVSQVVAMPPSGHGVLEVSGDLPPAGGATLGVYTEMDYVNLPAPRSSSRPAPPPAGPDQVILDAATAEPSSYGGSRLVQALTVGHDSTIRVWAGQTGRIGVTVDGLPATDDGDVAALMASMGVRLGDVPSDADPVRGAAARDHLDWRTQQPDVRDGYWLVHVPGVGRTFDLPATARPAPGERRVVVVEVLVDQVQMRAPADEVAIQVAVDNAEESELDTDPVAAQDRPRAPELVLGHRLLGEWEVPSDGHVRELRFDRPARSPHGLKVLIVRDRDSDMLPVWDGGTVDLGGDTWPLWVHHDLDDGLRNLEHLGIPDGSGPLSVSVPPALGHPPATVMAYAPVPYDAFDFTAAAVPPGSWPAESPTAAGSRYAGTTVLEVLGPEDLEDGQVVTRVDAATDVVAHVTTEGKGRMRFLAGGRAADQLTMTDGWWSSWTDDAVTSEVLLTHQAGPREVTVVVEDYEDFTITLLAH